MKLRIPIANRFTVLGIIAVFIGVCVTATAFLWQEFLILRMAQRAYLGSIIRAAQHVLPVQRQCRSCAGNKIKANQITFDQYGELPIELTELHKVCGSLLKDVIDDSMCKRIALIK